MVSATYVRRLFVIESFNVEWQRRKDYLVFLPHFCENDRGTSLSLCNSADEEALVLYGVVM